jgi:hypothetical protein
MRLFVAIMYGVAAYLLVHTGVAYGMEKPR